MKGKRARTARRVDERAAQKVIADREKLARLSPGGTPEHPIGVVSSAVIDGRATTMRCPLCDGHYRLRDHVSEGAGLRRLDLTCHDCGTPRSIWFRLGTTEPN